MSLYRVVKYYPYLKNIDKSLKYKIAVIVNLCFFKIINKIGYFSKNSIKTKLHGVEFQSISLNTLCILYEEIFYKNEYYFRTENKNPIIIDCGSNVGMSILYFKTFFPNCTIHSFEPDYYAFDTLSKNFNKEKNVYLNNNALLNSNRELIFYYDSDHISSLSMSIFKQRESKNNIKVNAIKLSDYITENNISKIDFIKMDIEGAEIEVIEDLRESKLFNLIDKICIEFHHKFPGERSKLSTVLSILEEFKFEYQVYGDLIPKNSEEQFQDIILYCYK